MTRRRFLRATSLTLLILCLGAWGWSYFSDVRVSYGGTASRFDVMLCPGRIAFINEQWRSDSGFRYSHSRGARDPLQIFDGTKVLGFDFYDQRGPHPLSLWFLRVPLWFPTLLLAALTWWTWRKTRAKDGRGFAVEGEGGRGTMNAER